MRYEITNSFAADFKRLKPEHKATFKEVVAEKFAPACDAWTHAPDARQAYAWPKSLRIDEMRGTSGMMEMTWSFTSPDGRATFEFAHGDSGWICRWRRIGDHRVYGRP